MTVVIKYVDKFVECFETSKFQLAPLKEMNPLMFSVKVYSGKRLVAKRVRPFKWFYKHVTFKSRKVQAVVMEMQRKQAEAKAKKEDND